jgi:thermopsin
MRMPGRGIMAIAIVGILAFGALGVGASFGAHTAGVASNTAAASAASSPTNNVASSMATQALANTHARGLGTSVISVPRPSATPAQQAQAQSLGHVVPLYDAAPAPSGLAYYGLSEGKGGVVVPTTLQTDSLRGTIDSVGPGVWAQDLFASSPDSFGMQLNAVQTNVTLLGTSGYSFWTQDVVLYYPASGEMILVTNIWNFTGGSITNNALYSTSLGCILSSCAVDDFPYQGDLGYYYSELVVPFAVSYPWDLTFFMNSTLTSGRDGVDFAVDLSQMSGQNFNAQYDNVVFNSTVAGGPALRSPSPYTANGYDYNALGLTNDFELVFGGPDGGSNADLSAADATIGLGYWSNAAGAYLATPSAFNYGGETGETVTGINIAWADGPLGPDGLAKWATASSGPTIMRGLWGAGAPEGTVAITINTDPANAWIVFTPDNSTAGTMNFVYAQPFAESNLYGPTFWLTPGIYFLKIELSYYDQVPEGPTLLELHATTAKTLTINLHYNPLNGVYTPLWAFTNAEVAALSYSGNGTPNNPYMIFNNQYRDFAMWFGLYNDYTFPVYPGVFFYGTTVSAELDHAPSFTARTSTFQFPGQYLPATNQLQYWFWGVSSFALYDASNISGWFGAYAYYPFAWDSFNVIFYNSTGNLVAGNTFNTEAQALLMFAGGLLQPNPEGTPTVNTGGGSNTVWGNTFNQLNAPTISGPAEELMPFYLGIGLEVAENSDLVYNNWFATPTTAFMLPFNLYSDYAYLYTDQWNITPTGAAHINTAPGFPTIPLTGSIAGGSKQGGNWWWDYGTTSGSPNPYNGAINPYGVLPYDENATTLVAYYFFGYYDATYIYNGGDYAPFMHALVHLGS